MCFMASKIYTIRGNVSGASLKRSEICVSFGRLKMRVNDCQRAKYWAALQYAEGPAGFGINSDPIIKCSVLIAIWARALLHLCWFALAAFRLFILEPRFCDYSHFLRQCRRLI